MAQPTEPHHQSPAADADILGEDASFDGHIEQPGSVEREPASASGSGVRREPGGRAESGRADAGKDINQAGFLKDEDAGQP
jgi:hypothetical protein